MPPLVKPLLAFCVVLALAHCYQGQQQSAIFNRTYKAVAFNNTLDGILTNLQAYTVGLELQKVDVLTQAIRVPSSLFSQHPCQVVYLGNPDWATLHLDVQFVDGISSPGNAAGSCSPGQRPQTFYAYVDGRGPSRLGQVLLSSSAAPWAAVLHESFRDADTETATAAGDGAVAGGHRRRLRQSSTSDGPSITTSIDSVRGAMDAIQMQSREVQELLHRGEDIVPGPDGPLAEPLLLSTRVGATTKTDPYYLPGPMLDLLKIEHEARPVASVLAGTASVYWAPESDCLAFMPEAAAAAGANSTASAAGARQQLGVTAQDSCYATQLVVYLYNPCAPGANAASGSTSGDGTSNAGLDVAASLPESGTPGELLGAALSAVATSASTSASGGGGNGSHGAGNGTQGYVLVSLRYTPYEDCVRMSIERITDKTYEIFDNGLYAFVGLWGALLLPTIFLIFVEFPIRALMYPFRKLLLRFKAGPPLELLPYKVHWTKPATAAGRFFAAPLLLLAKVLMPVLWVRKHILYAVATIHSANGQFRLMQVCRINNAALAVVMMVYLPTRILPLNHFLPPHFAMSIPVSSSDTASFFTVIAIDSCYLGALAYLSMLANYNLPSNKYYVTQVVISFLAELLLDTLLLLQLLSLVVQWTHMVANVTFLPVIVFQFANLAVAMAAQAVVLSRVFYRHADFSGARVATSSPLAPHKQHLDGGHGDRAAGGGDVNAVVKVPSLDANAEGDGGRGADGGRTGRGGLQTEKGKKRQRGRVSDPGRGPGAVARLKKGLKVALRSVSDSTEFRYPAWLLAALLIAGEMVVFHYGRAVHWATDTIPGCLDDPAVCAGKALSRYLRIGQGLLSRQNQATIGETLTSLLATRGAVEGAVVDLASNSDSLLAGVTANITSSLNQISDTLVGTVAPNISSLLADALSKQAASAGLDGVVGSAQAEALLAALGPGLEARLQATVSSAIATALSGTADQLTALASSPQTTAAVAQAVGLVSTAVEKLYDAVNTTSGLVTRGMKAEAQVGLWRRGLEHRLRWSAALGFTLGLLLGLSSLVQTAAAFRRAVRRGRRMRVLERITSLPRGPGGDAAGAAQESRFQTSMSTVLVNKAKDMKIGMVVFFCGILMSTAVIQLYAVGILFTVALAVISHPWTWSWLMPRIWPFIVAIFIVIFVNKVLFVSYLGNAFLSNGDYIYRPAAFMAFLTIMSITNLMVGLLLALYRIILLLVTTVLSLGKLEDTLFSVFAFLDEPHNTFLAGLHLHAAMANFHDPVYTPGPRGAAHRHWRKLREAIRGKSPEELKKLVAERGGGRDAADPREPVQQEGAAVDAKDVELAMGHTGHRHGASPEGR